MTTTRGAGRGVRTAPWDPAAAHRFVTADGTALHVSDSGPGHGAGPTLILLHGWTLDHTEWDAVVAALPPGTAARVIRYDHRGHGGSAPAPEGTATIEQIADDLAELIAARVPTGPLLLVGHSMGGATIMALVERHPDLIARIAGAVFVATTSGGLSKVSLGLPQRIDRRLPAIEARIDRRLRKVAGAKLAGRPALIRPGVRWLVFGRRPRRADVADTAAQIARCHPRSMADFRLSLGRHERRAALAALRHVPTVVLAGGADRLLPLPHARIIADELGCELVIYPDAGHMLNVERTEDVAARIAATRARV